MKKAFKILGSIVILFIIIITLFIVFSDEKRPNESSGTITKKQFVSLKEGMSKKSIEEKLGSPASKEDDINQWDYNIIEGSTVIDKTVTLDFDPDDKLSLKLDSNYFQTEKDTPKDDNVSEELSEDEPMPSRQEVLEDEINTFIDDNFKSGTELTELELNDHMGTKKDGDYIALVYIKLDKVLTAKRGFNWTEKYTNYLAAELATKDKDITELVLFWSMPQFADDDYNVAKYTLKRNGKEFYFESKWQDNRILDK